MTLQLRGLALSAADLQSLTDWPDALIEDYLNILNSLEDITSVVDPIAALNPNQLVGTDSSSNLVSVGLSSFVAGTLNQVNVVSTATGGVVLSTPQDIHELAIPAFAGVKLPVTFVNGDYTLLATDTILQTNLDYDSGTVTVNIASDPDDGQGFNDGFGRFSNTAIIPIGKTYDYQYRAFFRFTGVDIPQGATITSAKVTFNSAQGPQTAILNLKVLVVDSDGVSLAAPVSYDTLFALSGISTGTDWDVTDTWAYNEDVDTPDISTDIEAIVAKSTWGTGDQAIIILIDDDGSASSAKRYVEQYYDGDEAFLTIEYTLATAGNVTVPLNLIEDYTGRPLIFSNRSSLGMTVTPGASRLINGDSLWEFANEDDGALIWSDGSNLFGFKLTHDWDDDGSEIVPVRARDFRVPTTNETNALFVDYSTDIVETNVNTVVSADFRVVSDSASYMLFVDYSANRVGINQFEPSSTLDIDGNVFISNGLQVGRTSSGKDGLIYSQSDQGKTMVFGANDSVGISCRVGTTTNSAFFIIQNSIERAEVLSTGIWWNYPGNDYDFRIDTPTYEEAFFVDAGNEALGIKLDTTLSGADLLLTGSTNPKIKLTSDGGRAVIFQAKDSEPYCSVGTYSGHAFILMASNTRVATVSSGQFLIEYGRDFVVDGSTDDGYLFYCDQDNDRVGIGTGSPGYPLHIYQATGNIQVRIETGNVSAVYFDLMNADQNWQIRNRSDGYFGIYDTTDSNAVPILVKPGSGSNRLVINDTLTSINSTSENHDFAVRSTTSSKVLYVDASTDRVGIGTDAPGSELHVVGEIRQSADEKFVSAAGNYIKLEDDSITSYSTNSIVLSSLNHIVHILDNNSNNDAGFIIGGNDEDPGDGSWMDIAQHWESGIHKFFSGSGSYVDFRLILDDTAGNDDTLGILYFGDGTDNTLAAISGVAKTGGTSTGGSLVFYTESIDGTTMNERMAIGSEGYVSIQSRLYAYGDVTTLESSLSNYPRLQINNTNDNTYGGEIRFYKNSASPADNDWIGEISWWGNNDADDALEFFNIRGMSTDVTEGEEDGYLIIDGRNQGTLVEFVRFQGNAGIYWNYDQADLDFNVRTTGNINTFRVDGGNDCVGIGMQPDGTADLQVYGRIAVGDGSVTDDSFWLSFYPQTAYMTIWHIGAGVDGGNQLEISTGNMGSEAPQFYFNSSPRFGIGVPPRATLDVYAGDSGAGSPHAYAKAIIESDVDTALLLRSPSTENCYIFFGDESSDTYGIIVYYHSNDTMSFKAGNNYVLDLLNDQVVVNQDGDNVDFRVESDAETHCLFVNASTNSVGIRTSETSDGYLTISGVNPTNFIKFIDEDTSNDWRIRIDSNGGFNISHYSDTLASTSYPFVITEDLIYTYYLHIRPEEVVINQNAADIDFRVESSGRSNMFFVDGGNDRVYIGQSSYRGTSANFSLQIQDPGRVELTAAANGIMGCFRPASSTTNSIRIDADPDDTAANSYVQIVVDGSVDVAKFYSDKIVFNDAGADIDFRVESDTLTHALFVEGSDGRVGIGESSPDAQLHVYHATTNIVAHFESGDSNAWIEFIDSDNTVPVLVGCAANAFLVSVDSNNLLDISTTEAVFNDGGDDTDFRVESTASAYQLFVRGSDGHIGIGESDPSYLLHLKEAGGIGAPRILLEAVDDGALGPYVDLYHNSTSPAAADVLGRFAYYGNDAGSTQSLYGYWDCVARAVTAGAVSGELRGVIRVAGVSSLRLIMNPSYTVFNEGGDDVDFRVESTSIDNIFFVDAGVDSIFMGNPGGYYDDNGVPIHMQVSSTDAVPDSSDSLFDSSYGLDGHTVAQFENLNAAAVTTGVAFRTRQSAAAAGWMGLDWVSNYTGRFLFRLRNSGGTGSKEYFRMQSDVGTVFNEGGDDLDFRVESNNNANMFRVDAGVDVVTIGTSTIPAACNSLNVSSGNSAGDPIMYISNPSNNTAGRGISLRFNYDDGVGATIYAHRPISGAYTDVTLSFYTGGNNYAGRIDADRRWVINQNSQDSQSVAGHTPVFQVMGDSSAESSMALMRFQNVEDGGYLHFAKSRSGSWGDTTVADGDVLGTIAWNANDGLDFATYAAKIYAQVTDSGVTYSTIGTTLFFEIASGYAADFNWTPMAIRPINGGANTQVLIGDTDETGYGGQLCVASAPASYNYPQLQLVENAGGAYGPVMEFYKDSTSPADNDVIGGFNFYANNNAATPEKVMVCYHQYLVDDVSDGSEDFEWTFGGLRNGYGPVVFHKTNKFGYYYNPDNYASIDFYIYSENLSPFVNVELGGDGRFGIGGAPNVNYMFHVQGDVLVDGVLDVVKRVHLTSTETDERIYEGAEIDVMWNVQESIDSTYFTHSTSTNKARITVEADGVYHLIVNLNFRNTTASNRNTPVAYVKVNGVEVTTTRGYSYDRGLSYGEYCTVKIVTLLELEEDDYIEIWADGHNVDATPYIDYSQCELHMWRL
jgi:hypothetical protein